LKKTLQLLTLCISLIIGNKAGAQYIFHVAGADTVGHGGDSGPARHAALRSPSDVLIDDYNSILIADGGPIGFKGDGCIRRIEAARGIITTIAGFPGAPDSPAYNEDGIPAIAARLSGCAAICIDTQKNILIADGIGRIRKVNMKTGMISTVVGSKTAVGYAGDNGPATAALLDGPCDVAVDAANNIYIVDQNNHSIRKVTALTGIITTVAGRNAKGYGGDGGPATLAKLNNPHGIYVTGINSFLIADYDNHRVREVSASGTITTFAGIGAPGFSGDGGKADTARLNQPAQVTRDASGNTYISDLSNQRIRKVTTTGIISTYAGNGKYFSGPDTTGDGNLAIKASILPYGLVFDACGDLYVGSTLNSVRVITPTLPTSGTLCGILVNEVPNISSTQVAALTISPNPNTGTFSFNLPSSVNEPMQVTVTDITGRKVLEMAGKTNTDTNIQLNSPAGMYFVTAATASGKSSAKVVVE